MPIINSTAQGQTKLPKCLGTWDLEGGNYSSLDMHFFPGKWVMRHTDMLISIICTPPGSKVITKIQQESQSRFTLGTAAWKTKSLMATALPLVAVNVMLSDDGSAASRSSANCTLRLFLSNTVIDGNADKTARHRCRLTQRQCQHELH